VPFLNTLSLWYVGYELFSFNCISIKINSPSKEIRPNHLNLYSNCHYLIEGSKYLKLYNCFYCASKSIEVNCVSFNVLRKFSHCCVVQISFWWLVAHNSRCGTFISWHGFPRLIRTSRRQPNETLKSKICATLSAWKLVGAIYHNLLFSNTFAVTIALYFLRPSISAPSPSS
jgi:hypothetical protein